MCPLDCNLGECINQPGGGKPKCNCPSLYTGEHCEQYICSQYCKNKATCRLVSTRNETLSLKCICPPHYTGEHCEIPINICKNHCFNDGICYISRTGVPQCSCKAGFSGTRCQNCAKLTCQNGGTCIKDDNGKEKCLCGVNYYGKMCEHHSNCSQFCLNGGTCRLGAKQQPMCVCPPSYSGKKCENYWCDSKFCNNRCNCGKGGVCQTVADNVVCRCFYEWIGEHCDVSYINSK